MRLHRTLALAFLPLQALLAQTPAGSARGDATPARDLELEARVDARRDEISRFVRPEARRKISAAVRGMMERIRSGHAGDLAETARGQVRMQFGKLKPQQTDLLAFSILAETARALANPGQMDEALTVESQIDVLQGSQMKEVLQKDSALMSALKAMLTWVENVEASTIANVK